VCICVKSQALNLSTQKLSCKILSYCEQTIEKCFHGLHGLFFEMARECHHGGCGPNFQVDQKGINKTTTSTFEQINNFL